MYVKKSVLIICFMLILTIIPISQANIHNNTNKMDNTWMKTFGRFFNDEIGVSVQQTNDGGYVVVGAKSMSLFDIHGNRDMWLMKFDETGSIVWDKTYGGLDNDVGSSVQQTLDGGYIITGYTESYSEGKKDVWLVKTDENGDKLWEKTFGYSNFDSGSMVRQTSDGGYIVVGDVNTSGGGLGYVLLIKVDTDGEFLWVRSYGEKGHNYADEILQTQDEGYIIIGSSWVRDETDTYDIWLIKVDKYGDVMWDNKFYRSDSDHGWSIDQTDDGGYIIVGETDHASDEDKVWLLKTDENGNMIWDKIFEGRGFSVKQTLDGGYIIAGATMNPTITDFSNGLLIKTDSNGELEWRKTYGGRKPDFLFSVQQTTDNGYIITGDTNTWFDSDLWLIKTDSEGNAPKTIIKNFEGEIEKTESKSIDSDDSKKLVHLIGKCYSYGFGGYMHIGRLWWCPNPKYSVDFSFTPEDLYIFRVNGKNQVYNEDSSQIDISMVKFFGLAPTLINFVFIPPSIIHIYGICSEVNIRERE